MEAPQYSFSALKARVKSQAAVALDAAKTMSNFDEMAATDDYIHHDDLKTPGVPSASSSNRTNNNTNNNNRVVDRTTTQQLLLEATRFSSEQQQQQGGGASQFDNNISRPSPLTRTLMMEEEDEDGMIRNGDNDKYDEESQLREEEDVSSRKKKKNPQRFLQDLDDRIASTENGNDRVLIQQQPLQSTTPQASSQQSQWEWIKSPVSMTNVLSKLQTPTTTTTKSEEMAQLVVGPLSARRVQEEQRQERLKQQQQDEDDIVIVTSSAVFSAAEQDELERFKTSNNPLLPPIDQVSNLLHKYRDFAFIAFTLLLASGVYFYTRHKEEIDDGV